MADRLVAGLLSLGVKRLVQAFFVPVYQRTSHFVWANSLVPDNFGTYQKIPGTRDV